MAEGKNGPLTKDHVLRATSLDQQLNATNQATNWLLRLIAELCLLFRLILSYPNEDGRNALLQPPSRPQSSNPATENRATQKGWINTFYRYYKGKKLGPYYVRRWKTGNKIHREYIKPKDIERVRAECLAYREKRTERRAATKRINTLLDNFGFLGRMLDNYTSGKEPTGPQGEYIKRLHEEGMHINGKPRERRRVTRCVSKHNGKDVIVKTVFELDGTTKVFMVPFFTSIADYIDHICEEVQKSISWPSDRSKKHRNAWLQAAH